MISKHYYKTGLLLVLIILINVAALQWHGQWDLTRDQLYTSHEQTKMLVNSVNDEIDIEVYLAGKMPATLKRLKLAVEDRLFRLNKQNHNIHYKSINPTAGDIQAVNAKRRYFSEEGLAPMRVNVNDENSSQLIYPYALFRYGQRKVYVNLLEPNKSGLDPEAAIDESIGLLEYKFSNAVQKLFQDQRYKICLTEGHEELTARETADLERSLNQYYDVSRINLDSSASLSQDIKLLIVAKPKHAFNDHEKLVIDQYMMNGGNVMFLIDPLYIDVRHLQQTGQTASIAFDLNLDDLLFKYGIRLNPVLVADAQATKIPLKVGRVGGKDQYNFFTWPYHIVSTPKIDHPIINGLDPLNLEYVSNIDIVSGNEELQFVPLITSSLNTTVQANPAQVDLSTVSEEPSLDLFNKGEQLIGVLIEGTFNSLYTHRIGDQDLKSLGISEDEFKSSSVPTKLMVIADGDIARNRINQNGVPEELGYNQYINYLFSNKRFLINSIEYMINDHNLLELKNKTYQVRLLDQAKIRTNREIIQAVNLLMPIMSILCLWGIFSIYRKRKYGRAKL